MKFMIIHISFMEYIFMIFHSGIGISRVDQSGGDWQYNLHQGASDQWLSISNNTLLLGENGNVTYQSLRFLPNPEYSGAAFLYFHCWDFTNNLLNGDTTVRRSLQSKLQYENGHI